MRVTVHGLGSGSLFGRQIVGSVERGCRRKMCLTPWRCGENGQCLVNGYECDRLT